MKTYRNPQTGDKQRIDESNAAALAALEGQGYVQWGEAEIKQKIKDNDKAAEEARAKLAAAQKEVDAGHTKIKPLNPSAKLTTEADDERHASMRGMEDELASVTVETKQPSGATDVTTVVAPSAPAAPAVPKKN